MKDQDIIELLKQEDDEFKKLIEEHHHLDGQLAEMDKKVYLTPEEEVERKTLQKQKLFKKDKIAEIVRVYKKDHLAN